MLEPTGLLQEKYFPDRWKVAVTCILLNCTRRTQVENVIDDLFKLCPNPEGFLNCQEAQIKNLISVLGFKNVRYARVKQFTIDYIKGEWKTLRDCKGIGQYADACDRMFFLNEFDLEPPNDHALKYLWEIITSKHHERNDYNTNS